MYHHASSLDVLDGKILVGHDNGRIQVVNADGTDKQLVNVSHHDGEAWGLEVIQDKGTFLTCGDDNQLFEYAHPLICKPLDGNIMTANYGSNDHTYELW